MPKSNKHNAPLQALLIDTPVEHIRKVNNAIYESALAGTAKLYYKTKKI